MQAYLVSFDIAALFISCACLIHTFLHHRIDKRQNKFFVGLLALVAVGSVCSFAYTVLTPDVGSHLLAADASKYWYFVSHAALAPLLCYYMMFVSGVADRYGRRQLLVNAIPFAICELLVLTNPLTGWTYYFDAAAEYHRNWVIYLMYVVSVLYLLLGTALFLRYWRGMTRVRRVSLILYVALVLAGIAVQLVFPAVKVELFAEALALMGMMLSVENEDDRMDMETGVYSRRAFILDFDNMVASGGSCEVVCVRLTNASLVVRVMDRASYSSLIGQVADWLKTLAPRYRIYRVTSTSFILVSVEPGSGQAEAWAQAVKRRFEDAWRVSDVEIPFKALVMRAALPEEFSVSTDVLAMAEGPLPAPAGGRVLSGADLDYLKRRSQVERAVARGLEQGNFEVYYQPICRVDGTVCAAEALMRLHDPELGDVPPFEFIEVAERSGGIDRIGMFGLKEVCRFLATGLPEAAGIESIHVNLSVIQCLQPDFADEVRAVVHKYGVRPDQVNFEITESVAASDDGILSEMMHELAEDGFRFSMDDYGTGYSSTHSVFALDFNIVKIDKSILWDADVNSDGRYILESTMHMMHATGHKTVVEGVETRGQTDLLRVIGADYLQGFLYSKPLPREAFLEKVASLNAASR